MESIHLGTCKKRSLQAGGLYIQVVLRGGSIVARLHGVYELE